MIRNGCTILMLLTVVQLFAQEKNNFEDWENHPPLVTPGKNQSPPSDAKVLFSEGNLEKWVYADGNAAKWKIENETFMVTPGEPDIYSKQSFGDCQLHVEWKIPVDEVHDNLNWGNSGIYLMGLYEVQIYDSYNDMHPIYYNGQAGSIYKQHSPLVNASKPAGEWQMFDIVFTAPVFKKDQTLLKPAILTVFHNGILVQNHVSLIGPTTHENFTEYIFHESKLPLMLQSHGSKVTYRNIWIREL